jgi:hypothetical protein
MQRLVLVLFVLLLLLDLVDDGFSGKVKCVSPASPLSDSLASCSPYSAEQVDSWCGPPVPEARAIFHHYQKQTVTFNFVNRLKKKILWQTNNSGYIPL